VDAHHVYFFFIMYVFLAFPNP